MCGVACVCLNPEDVATDGSVAGPVPVPGGAVAGVASVAGEAAVLVDAMLGQLRHRGPDGSGVAAGPSTAVGMVRLRVRSAPGDHVPFAEPDGGTVFAFNGEVYQGSEGIPAGGLEEARAAGAPGAAHSVDGMYAMVSGRPGGPVRAVRDPLGIKPLYLRESARGVALASEVAPLIDVFGRAPVRRAAFAQFLLTGRRVVDGGSFFEGIRPLAPGETLTVRDGRVQSPAHTAPEPTGRTAPTPAELRAAVEEALDRVLLTDRQIGLALSGGLDSTILATLLARRGIRDLPTVSVLPQETGDGVGHLSDLGLPGDAAAGWRHHAVPFGPQDLLAGIPAVVRALGEPVAMSSLPMYRTLAATARAAGITVLLVGEGADELFAGYNRYVPLHGGAFADPLDFYLPPGRRELVAGLLGEQACEEAVDALRQALGRARRTAAARRGDGPGVVDVVDVVREFEFEHSLEPLLRRTDHLLMAEGIEGRTPFLHAGLPALARRCPSPSLVSGGLTKAVLREAFADVLPERHRLQPKQPFRAPVDRWLQGPRLPGVDRTLELATPRLREELGVRPDGMRHLREQLARGGALASGTAFALLTTAEWLGWLDGPTGAEAARDG